MKVDRIHGVNLIYNIYHESLGKNEQYILDSNVVVNIEKAFYHPSKMSEDKLRNLMMFLRHVNNENKNCEYSHALSELSIDLIDGELERKKYYGTKRAVSSILNLSIPKLEKHIKYHKSKNLQNHEPKQKSNQELFNSIRDSLYNTSRIVIVSYLPMLKFYQLIRIHGMQKKETIFREVLEYMTKVIGSISLYEIAAITYFLFSSKEEFNHSQSLMKVNNNIDLVRKAWNVSWDMSFLRIMNTRSASQRSGEELGDNYNRVLATNDRALSNLAEAMISDETAHFDGKYVSNVRIDPEKLSPKYHDFYSSISTEFNSHEQKSVRKRALENLNAEEKVERLIKITESLIKDLIKS